MARTMVPCSFSCLPLRYLARRIFLFFCASFRAASVACFGSSTPDPDPAAASFCVDLRLRLDCHCAAAARATTSPHPSFAEHTKHPCLPQGVGFLRQQPMLLFCRQRQHLLLSTMHFDFLPGPRLRGGLLPPMVQSLGGNPLRAKNEWRLLWGPRRRLGPPPRFCSPGEKPETGTTE